MLSNYNPVDIAIALTEENPDPPFPPASDRTAWDEVRQAIGSQRVLGILQQAEYDAEAPVPALPATLYLGFKRDGQREDYQTPASERRSRLSNMVIAECLECQGRFLDSIMNLVWAICEESSWSLPAHQTDLADMDKPIIDLAAAATGFNLAELDSLLGKELDPAIRKRICYETNRRLFQPYLHRNDHWWLFNTQIRSLNNWTAVCNAGVVGAAIYLMDDPDKLAKLIARAARSLDDYLQTFDRDGGSTEGPGYWAYGFGNFVLLAHLVEHRTNGRVSFLEDQLIHNISQFPLRTMLSPGKWINFSDCDPEINFPTALLVYLGWRMELPQLVTIEQMQSQDGSTIRQGELTWNLRNLFWRPEDPDMIFKPTRHDWYSGMTWMLSRYNPENPNGLVLAVKGGHNQEMHNQNDVGAFVVHYKGESIIADSGRGRYTRDYFRAETRYDHFVNQSFAHSTPVPNGQQQLAGEQSAAELIEHRATHTHDYVIMELQDAYPPKAQLRSLRRTVTFHREAPQGWVELVDEYTFLRDPGNFETVLITFGEVGIMQEEVVILGTNGSLRVRFDSHLVVPHLEIVPDVDLSTGPQNIYRVRFVMRELAISGVARLWIHPI